MTKLASIIASKSPIAILGVKHTINRHRNALIDQGLTDVVRTNMSQIQTRDVFDAITASFQKKAANYQKL